MNPSTTKIPRLRLNSTAAPPAALRFRGNGRAAPFSSPPEILPWCAVSTGSLRLSSNAAFKPAGKPANQQRRERRGSSYCSTHPVPATAPPSCSGAALSPTPLLTLNLAAPKARSKETAPGRTGQPSCLPALCAIAQTFLCSLINPDWAANL